jgi:hypothetical protein
MPILRRVSQREPGIRTETERLGRASTVYPDRYHRVFGVLVGTALGETGMILSDCQNTPDITLRLCTGVV